MLKIKTLVFNDFGVNTYVLSDEGKCIVVDPGMYSQAEKKEFDNYIKENNLVIEKLLLTHTHIDHILGIAHIEDNYQQGAVMHSKSAEFLRASVGYASVFGFELERVIKPAGFVEESEIISLGSNNLKVIYTPGHAEGSICLSCHEQQFVITGDVLFYGSIGRTDLPTGDFGVLMHSIKNKLFVLQDDFVVYPGHGPTTTIGFEKNNNPYLM